VSRLFGAQLIGRLLVPHSPLSPVGVAELSRSDQEITHLSHVSVMTVLRALRRARGPCWHRPLGAPVLVCVAADWAGGCHLVGGPGRAGCHSAVTLSGW